MTQHIVIDIETNGTVCPIYNLLSIGAVHHQNPTDTFYCEMRPLNRDYQQKAYEVNGFTHDQVMLFPDAPVQMEAFLDWVKKVRGRDERVVFVSDTTSFDFSFVNYYLWHLCAENPFGHAPLSITNLNKGVTGNLSENIYKLRKTKHTHNALDDAKGNQEAFEVVLKRMAKQKARREQERPKSVGSMTNTQLADALRGLDVE